MKYNYFLFDWDGTLVDSLPIWIETYKKLFHKYGIFVTKTDILEKAYGNPLGCQYFGINNYEQFNYELFEFVEAGYLYASSIPGAVKLLHRLKAEKKKIGLITNTAKALVYKLSKINGMFKYFDVLVAREDVKNLKPHPESVFKALEKLDHITGYQSDTVIIGDAESDILAGKQAGIDTILVASKKSGLPTCKTQPTLTFDSLMDMNINYH